MRIALLGDFDTYLTRGLERPPELLPYRLSPGLNLLRGFRELGVADIHILVTTKEVPKPTVEQGPFGTVHRLPQPPFSGAGSFQLWRRRLILQQLRQIRPDIVHGHGTEAEYAFTAISAPYPNVITLHGLMHRVQQAAPPPLLSLNHVARWIEKRVVRQATDVICLTREVEEFLAERGSRARRHRIPNAVAPCFFDVRPGPRDRPGFAVLFVGTVYRLKGVLHLVEAMAAARQKLGAPLTLRIVGSTGGPADAYEELLRRRAAELGVAGDIEWLGVLGERDVAAQLARSDALALPSFTESFGMCVAEAMAAGVPAVGSRAGGIPDLIEDGKTGLLVTPGRSDELAAALVRALTDTALRARMVDAARAKALACYSPRAVAGQTRRVYEEICRRPE